MARDRATTAKSTANTNGAGDQEPNEDDRKDKKPKVRDDPDYLLPRIKKVIETISAKEAEAHPDALTAAEARDLAQDSEELLIELYSRYLEEGRAERAQSTYELGQAIHKDWVKHVEKSMKKDEQSKTWRLQGS